MPKDWFVFVQDDSENTGGFLILFCRSLDPNDEEGFDDWVENFECLEKYFKGSRWQSMSYFSMCCMFAGAALEVIPVTKGLGSAAKAVTATKASSLFYRASKVERAMPVAEKAIALSEKVAYLISV